MRVRLTPGIDTDRFDTFSRDIDRTGSQLDAARAKIAAAFEISPGARVAVASEGSFGPHPQIPFLPLAREIVVMKERVAGLELIGLHAGMQTNFSHAVVAGIAEAMAFADRAHFPGHGVIVIGCIDRQPAPDLALIEDIGDWADLERATETVIATCGAAFIETDMRAHRNPSRMRTIKYATLDLVRRFLSPCPMWCGGPTSALQADVFCCEGCGYRREHAVKAATADPGQCSDCNPGSRREPGVCMPTGLMPLAAAGIAAAMSPGHIAQPNTGDNCLTVCRIVAVDEQEAAWPSCVAVHSIAYKLKEC